MIVTSACSCRNDAGSSVVMGPFTTRSMHAAFDHIKGHIIEWRKCEDIDLEAEDLDRRIQDVISHVDELESKVGDFYTVVSGGNTPSKPH